MATLQFDVAGLNAVISKMDALVSSLNEQRAATRRVSDEQRQLERVALQTIRSQETAQDRYNRKVGELKRAMDANLLSQKQYNTEVGKLNKEMGTLQGRFSDFDKKNKSSFGANIIRNIASYAASVLSISTAMAAITEDLRAQQEIINKEREAGIELEKALLELKHNALTLTDKEFKEMVKMAQVASRETGQPLSTVIRGSTYAFSAGESDREKAVAASKIASQFVPDEGVQGQNIIVQALIDIMQALGTKDANKALGTMGFAGEISSIADATKMADTLPAAMNAWKAAGGDPMEALLIYAAATKAGPEHGGKITAHAVAAMADQLSSFQRENWRGFLGRDPVTGQEIKAPEMNIDQLAARMREDKKLADFFRYEQAKKFTVRERLRPAFREWLGGEKGIMMEEYLGGKEKMGSVDLGATADKMLKEIPAMAPLLHRRLKGRAAEERELLEGKRRGYLDDEERLRLYNALIKSGLPSATAGTIMKIRSAGGISDEEAREIIGIRMRQTSTTFGKWGTPPVGNKEELNELLRIFGSGNDKTDTTNKLLEKINASIEKSNRGTTVHNTTNYGGSTTTVSNN